jgi:hypothetical protein
MLKPGQKFSDTMGNKRKIPRIGYVGRCLVMFYVAAFIKSEGNWKIN